MFDDNQAVAVVISHLTSRSPAMMDELRKLWKLIDTNNISILARYIRPAANVWADRLSRETNRDDMLLNPRIFTYLDSQWGPHSIDKLAPQGNKLLPRYNARWRDPSAEALDCLHLPDRLWTSDTKWCNLPWTLLPDLVHKLRQSGAEATVIALYWPAKQWYQLLSELSGEQILYPPPEIYSFRASAERTRESDRPAGA
jgi:hypothetical protein